MKKQNGSEIIGRILTDLDMKAPTFSKNIGVSYMRVNNIETGKTLRVSPKIANAIVDKYPQFNFAWILSGYGNMYVDNTHNSIEIKDNTQTSESGNNSINGTIEGVQNNYSYHGLSKEELAHMNNDRYKIIKIKEKQIELVLEENKRLISIIEKLTDKLLTY